MITLYQPQPMFGLPSSSPFCLKLEAFLRWQSIKFVNKHALPFEGPYKKIPFVDYQGQRLGDSSLIIDQLLTDLNISYDKHLNLSVGHSFAKLMEEQMYWVMVYFRWMDQETWPILKKAFFGSVPKLIKPIIIHTARKQAKSALYGLGIGRLPVDSILSKAQIDLNALENQLKQSTFICGDIMTHYDLSIWAVLSQFMQSNFHIKLSDLTLDRPVLKDYIKRVNQQLAPYWQNSECTQIFNSKHETT
ncbi:MAG: glutathione S-transferase family protein [Saccharospirillaceae bacterium]|nr:glutathione S-transferase family protein [Saccharospirillaceae bacterium]